VEAKQQGFVGYGNAQLTEDTLAAALAGRTFIAGDRFSAADLYLCAKLDFALAFGNLPKRPEFLAYCAAHAERPAKRRAAALDDAAVSS
jgi:glutathione S-transferase